MNKNQILAMHSRLISKVTRAQSAYSIARGMRKDSGANIESSSEARARQRRDAADDALKAFQREHGLTMADDIG